jgi:hypothetical protein
LHNTPVVTHHRATARADFNTHLRNAFTFVAGALIPFGRSAFEQQVREDHAARVPVVYGGDALRCFFV